MNFFVYIIMKLYSPPPPKKKKRQVKLNFICIFSVQMTDRHYVKWFVHIDWLTGLPVSIIEVCFINFMNIFFTS